MYAVAVLTLVAAPLRHATAQDAALAKPVAIVSLASPNKLMGDVTYLTRAAGAEDVGQLVVVMAGAAIQGLDKTKPAGVVITMDGPQPKPLGFVGVKDLNI
jgi:hypothetical protein